MSEAVHTQGGLWIAPAAPGFDARLIGGKNVVERKEGQTLVKEMNAALLSNPDAIGLISWNEFSENTHIEPSELYGTDTLDRLADIQGALPPTILDFDSNAPATTDHGNRYTLYLLVLLIVFFGVSLSWLLLRNIRSASQE